MFNREKIAASRKDFATVMAAYMNAACRYIAEYHGDMAYDMEFARQKLDKQGTCELWVFVREHGTSAYLRGFAGHRQRELTYDVQTMLDIQKSVPWKACYVISRLGDDWKLDRIRFIRGEDIYDNNDSGKV